MYDNRLLTAVDESLYACSCSLCHGNVYSNSVWRSVWTTKADITANSSKLISPPQERSKKITRRKAHKYQDTTHVAASCITYYIPLVYIAAFMTWCSFCCWYPMRLYTRIPLSTSQFSVISLSTLLTALQCTCISVVVLWPQSFYLSSNGRKNRHRHWVSWMSTGRKNGLIWRTHTNTHFKHNKQNSLQRGGIYTYLLDAVWALGTKHKALKKISAYQLRYHWSTGCSKYQTYARSLYVIK